jgi:hypothetical protein
MYLIYKFWRRVEAMLVGAGVAVFNIPSEVLQGAYRQMLYRGADRGTL